MPAADPLIDSPTICIKTNGDGDRRCGDWASRTRLLLKQGTAEPVPNQIADGTMNWYTAKRELGRQLKKLLKDAGVEKADVRIEADPELRHEFVLEVYDVCKSAGFARILFVPPPNRLANR